MIQPQRVNIIISVTCNDIILRNMHFIIDSSRGVEVFGRRRHRHAVGSDARDIRARENTNGLER